MLHNIDEKHKEYIYASWRFNIFCNGFDNFGDRLTIEDAVADDETTQVGA